MLKNQNSYFFNKIFIVSPKIQLWLGVFSWSLLWYGLYTEPTIRFPSGDLFVDFLIFSVVFVGVPFGTIQATWKIKIEGDVLFVSKFFGFVRRKYSFQELKNAEISIKKEGTKFEAIKIKFPDGVNLKIDPLCSGYKRFKEIITHLGLF